eukprot:CAMPEP_0113726450 /NCGR_PEP_ID=MMETSP0038_2-20120614/40452_1 /TAXON_ID=2898 /ORGANISM="Cryptomonas paramecium" /LENGTH=65 /DNA_ID=CAMNT_0000657085 /DNA_START=1 /DNA_END=195 /DNA_ORIENTATION=- /assembly_acc=CAM_ASM_000170
MTETYSAAPEPEDSDAEESGDEVEIVPMRRAMMDLDSLAISNARVQSSITSFFSPAPSRQEAGPA